MSQLSLRSECLWSRHVCSGLFVATILFSFATWYCYYCPLCLRISLDMLSFLHGSMLFIFSCLCIFAVSSHQNWRLNQSFVFCSCQDDHRRTHNVHSSLSNTYLVVHIHCWDVSHLKQMYAPDATCIATHGRFNCGHL